MLSPALQDRENDKFQDTSDGPSVRVSSKDFFTVPQSADAFTVELANSNLDVVYKFRQGGISGTVLSTITLTYNSAQTLDVVSGTIT